jgi:hypothetical protein
VLLAGDQPAAAAHAPRDARAGWFNAAPTMLSKSNELLVEVKTRFFTASAPEVPVGATVVERVVRAAVGGR